MEVNIVLIDDQLKENDPFIVELKEKENIETHLFKNGKEGLNYIVNNLDKLIVVILDIRLGTTEKGHDILKKIRAKTQLIPVIIWSAYNGKEEDFTDFVENNVFAYISKSNLASENIKAIDSAIESLRKNVDVALEEWLKVRSDRNQVMLVTKSGKQYTANELIKEIRCQTSEGISLQNKINKLTIDLLFRGKEEI